MEMLFVLLYTILLYYTILLLYYISFEKKSGGWGGVVKDKKGEGGLKL